MNLQVKPALIIIGTLLIGIVLGALISGALAERRYREIRCMLRSDLLTERLIEIIEPLEDKQREEVRAIVEQTSVRVRNLTRETRFEMHAVMDSLFAELQPLLTDRQKARLEKHIGNRRARAMKREECWGPNR